MRASVATAAAFALALSQGVVAGPVEKRATVAYVTVKTEDNGLTWCNPYADFVAPLDKIVANFYEPTAVNATCWTETTMKDDKGIQNGNPTWLRLSAPVGGQNKPCWITEEFLQAGKIDFTKKLKYCAPPQHQVGMPKDAYATSDLKFKCYATPATSAAVTLLNFGYTDLACWTKGENVKGSTKWAKAKDANCYIPNDVFVANEFHGNSGGNC